MNPNDDQKLERLIHQTLRGLPSRHAPGALELRVLAEIDRRALLPWWKKNFTHWPVAVRATFIVFTIGLAKLLLMGGVWVMAGFDNAQFQAAFATQFAWMETGVSLVHVLTDSIAVIIRSIPPLWLYGGVAIVGSLYVALFGLSAAAYRMLFANR